MDLAQSLAQRVADAAAGNQSLSIRAGGSKGFYGEPTLGEPLDVSEHTGIVSYEPTELMLTARAGTRLDEIRSLLAEQGQQLAFDPPHFNGPATLGGALAAGLAGPARPWHGAPRDQVLGVRLIDGLGRDLRFGGQVMKNVAGYDVSRLMAGAMGTLGVLLEISVKVLPAPALQATQRLELPREQAMARVRELMRQPAPLAGASYHAGLLYIRLAGAPSSIEAWRGRLGGESLVNEGLFWRQLRDQQRDFFYSDRPLWRLSLAADAPPLACEEDVWLDWGGAQRWVHSNTKPAAIRQQVAQWHGHATLFRNGPEGVPAFHPLPSSMRALQQRLKQQFDPKGILNSGRLGHV